MSLSRRKRAGFTLVELLVVIAIIGILVGLLLPAVQAAREAARRMQCSNNMKQIGLAFLNYESAYKSFPASWYVNPPVPPYNIQSCGVGLLPFLEQSPLYNQFDSRFSSTNEGGPISQKNVTVISTPLSTFVCPSAPGGISRVYNGFAPAGALPGLPQITWRAAPSDYCVTSGVRGAFAAIAYAGHGGPGGNRGGALQQMVFVRPIKSKIASLTDGTSNTFLMGERTGGDKFYVGQQTIAVPPPFNGLNGGGWGDPLNGEHWLSGAVRGAPFPSPEGGCAINCNNFRGSSFHSFHTGGCQFVYADGSVHFVTENVDAYTLASYITRAKSEVPNPIE